MVTTNINYNIQGGEAPYSFEVTTLQAGVTIIDPIRTSAVPTLVIELMAPQVDFPFDINIQGRDANGCTFNTNVTVTSPCVNISPPTISLVNADPLHFQASPVAGSCLDTGLNTRWEYPQEYFTTSNPAVQTGSAAYLRLVPNPGIAIPEGLQVTAITTNCEGCEVSSSVTINYCVPRLSRVSRFYTNVSLVTTPWITVTPPANCSTPLDYTTLVFNLPSEITGEYQIVNTGTVSNPNNVLQFRFTTTDSSITTIAGSYSCNTVTGIEAIPGQIIIRVAAIQPGDNDTEAETEDANISNRSQTITVPNSATIGDVVSRTIPSSSFNSTSNLADAKFIAGDAGNASIARISEGLRVNYTIPSGFVNEYLWVRVDPLTVGDPSESFRLNYTISPISPTLQSTTDCTVCGTDKEFDVLTGQGYSSWVRSSVRVTTPPSVGVAQVTAQGRIIYSAPPNYSGVVTIEFTAMDEFGVRTITPATLTINVSCTPSAITTEIC